MFYCNGTYPNNYIDSARTFDNGVTWRHWQVLTDTDWNYCPSVIPDTHDNLHIIWQGDSDTMKIYYNQFNCTNGTWSIKFADADDYGKMISTGAGNSFQPTMDIDGQNKLWAVWYVDLGGAKYRDEYAYSTDLGGTWTAAGWLDTDDIVAKQSLGMFAFDDNSNGAYVWTGTHAGSANYVIRMKKYWHANDTWNKYTINVSLPLGYESNQKFASVVCDNKENFHIAWWDIANDDVYYRMYNYTNQSFTGITKIDDGGMPSLSIDDQNQVYMVYEDSPIDQIDSHFYTNKIFFVYGTYGSWSSPIQGSRTTADNLVDPCAHYSRFPVNPLSGLPVNRPTTGFVYIYLNDTQNKIVFKAENVTFSKSEM